MPYLHMQSISKSFPGVRALQDVSFELAKGEIHALVGENGAGKSTLMKVLTGAYKGDSGEITLDGKSVVINSPGDAQSLGISMIHQELSLIPYLTVGQNIYLGREPKGRLPGTIDWRTLYKEAQVLLDRLKVDVDAKDLVEGLSIAQQQMVEVAKALSLNADIIAMDEPTSSLTDRETDVLFRVMGDLRDQGVALIFISHRLDEVFAITDRVTVLRDGQWIATLPTAELDEEKIVTMMVGRDLGELYPKGRVHRQGGSADRDRLGRRATNCGGSALPCTEGKFWALPGWWARAARPWPRPSSACARPAPGRFEWRAPPCASSRRGTP